MNERINNLRRTFNFEKDVLITGKANIFYFSGFTSEDAMLLITPDDAYILLTAVIMFRRNSRQRILSLCVRRMD